MERLLERVPVGDRPQAGDEPPRQQEAERALLGVPRRHFREPLPATLAGEQRRRARRELGRHAVRRGSTERVEIALAHETEHERPGVGVRARQATHLVDEPPRSEAVEGELDRVRLAAGEPGVRRVGGGDLEVARAPNLLGVRELERSELPERSPRRAPRLRREPASHPAVQELEVLDLVEPRQRLDQLAPDGVAPREHGVIAQQTRQARAMDLENVAACLRCAAELEDESRPRRRLPKCAEVRCDLRAGEARGLGARAHVGEREPPGAHLAPPGGPSRTIPA